MVIATLLLPLLRLPGPQPYKRFQASVFRVVNRRWSWHQIPFVPLLGRLNLCLWNLPALRYDLRQRNLYDASKHPIRQTDELESQSPAPFEPNDLYRRRADGTYSDLQDPTMGSSCSRFGRNFPLDEMARQLDKHPGEKPTPRTVARELLTRQTFKPAESLNLLAAAWIQFQVHDWVRHRKDVDAPQHDIHIRLDDKDDWPQQYRTPDGSMKVQRTFNDPTRPPRCSACPPTFLTEDTHWWDASEIYGSSFERQRRVRSHQDGKLKTTRDENGHGRLLPEPNPKLSGIDLTGMSENYWVGLSLLHTLFSLEHNAICDELKQHYPSWPDDQLFWKAQLITAGLIAKIHTVEWTPAILGHPALQIGMSANWWGVFGEQFYKSHGRLFESDELSGVPGSPKDHHGVPFSLTEEFVSVYRMHPLIPDEYRFQSLTDPEQSWYRTFEGIEGPLTRCIIDEIGMDNVLYSFGLAHPGAITLGNFPHALRDIERDGYHLDLATVDVLRDRERGVPRYNDFRQLLRLRPVRSFNELNPLWASRLREVYNNRINDVDLMIGLYAETPPEGFGFGDTAFRIFILMASRRLKSDRFFTTDYRPEVYTPVGLEWINNNTMTTVLLRHYPTLGPAVHEAPNPFAPWRNVHELALA